MRRTWNGKEDVLLHIEFIAFISGPFLLLLLLLLRLLHTHIARKCDVARLLEIRT